MKFVYPFTNVSLPMLFRVSLSLLAKVQNIGRPLRMLGLAGLLLPVALPLPAHASNLPPRIEQALKAHKLTSDALSLALIPLDGVHACTDITGFGLIGHASEIAEASGVSVALASGAVPLFDGVRDLVAQSRSGGMATNREHFAGGVRIAPSVDEALVDLLYDPQTSGGLLVFIASEQFDAARAALAARGVLAAEIGRAIAPTGYRIELS